MYEIVNQNSQYPLNLFGGCPFVTYIIVITKGSEMKFDNSL